MWKRLYNLATLYRTVGSTHTDGIYYLLLLKYKHFVSHLIWIWLVNNNSLSLLGIPTYVLLNTSGISIPARVDLLELLSTSGSSLKTIPVKYYPDRKPYGIWNISDFMPPSEAFFLKITGYDKDDYLFQRVSSVSFSSIVPGETSFHSVLEYW